jgi:hypothetical protein
VVVRSALCVLFCICREGVTDGFLSDFDRSVPCRRGLDIVVDSNFVVRSRSLSPRVQPCRLGVQIRSQLPSSAQAVNPVVSTYLNERQTLLLPSTIAQSE